MMNYLKQIWFELRLQPMVTVTTILGTAFTIFLVMAVFFTGNVNSVAIAPESNRPRMMVGAYLDTKSISDEGRSGSGSINFQTAQKLYEGLEGVEKVAYTNSFITPLDISADNENFIPATVRMADTNFWDIFDFTFLSGNRISDADTKAGVKKAVLTKSTARKLFKTEDAVGKTLTIAHIPYQVVGVVRDVNPLMKLSFADLYVPYEQESPEMIWVKGMGNTQAYLLLSPGTEKDNVRRQVENRYSILRSEFKSDDMDVVYHGQPFDVDTFSKGDFGSNTTPDTDTPRRARWILYAILLILPAINLSTMTRSRLRRRVAEIGVRRAFGSTRLQIVGRLLGENLVMTVFGGIIGFIIYVFFSYFFCSLFYNFGGFFDSITDAVRPEWGMIFNWSSFLLAVLLCLVLNLLSAGLPAWKASGLNPAEAISGRDD